MWTIEKFPFDNTEITLDSGERLPAVCGQALLLLNENPLMGLEGLEGAKALGLSPDDIDWLVDLQFITYTDRIFRLTPAGGDVCDETLQKLSLAFQYDQSKQVAGELTEKAERGMSLDQLEDFLHNQLKTVAKRTFSPQLWQRESNHSNCCSTHCCPKHGCKYNNWYCPVAHGEVQPEYPSNNGCEGCEYDREDEEEYSHF